MGVMVWWTSPIARSPDPSSATPSPVPLNPDEIRSRRGRLYLDGGRWRSGFDDDLLLRRDVGGRWCARLNDDLLLLRLRRAGQRD